MCLTPSAQAKLRATKASGPDLLRVLLQAKALEAGNGGEVTDAEFSEDVGDGADPGGD